MARSKSSSGNKPDKSNDKNNKDQAIAASTSAAPPNGQTAVEAVSVQAVAEPRRFELRKSEPRASVVPINLEEEIRRRAYELYQQRGYSAGNEKDDWFVAEQEVMQRYRQQSA